MKISISTHNIFAANRHIEQLGKIFGPPCANNYATYDILLKAERRANKKATDYCNGVIDGEQFEKWEQKFLMRLKKDLHVEEMPAGFFINTDPRGYALKMKENSFDKYSGLWTDFGGYGILAPSFE